MFAELMQILKTGHYDIKNAGDEDNTAPKPDPTPTVTLNGLDEVKTYCACTDSIALLRHVLGLERLEGAPELLDHAIINVMDTETYSQDSTKLTEIGLVALSVRTLKDINAVSIYARAEAILKKARYYHYRLIPNAHLVNRRYCPGDPTKNRFGKTSFVTVNQTKAALRSAFQWKASSSQPKLGACPVIFVGHALRNDTQQLSKTLGFDTSLFESVVKQVDTQELARAVNIPSPGRNIALKNLCAYHDFNAEYPHTATNDAAYAFFCMVFMAMHQEMGALNVSDNRDPSLDEMDEGNLEPPSNIKVEPAIIEAQIKTDRSLIEEVIDRIAEYSVTNADTSNFGVELFCERCETEGQHVRRQCRQSVKCTLCYAAGRKGALTHKASRCIIGTGLKMG